MNDKRQTPYCELERCLYLLTHPDTTKAHYIQKFEISYRTYARDKTFIRDRLWQYEVKLREEEK